MHVFKDHQTIYLFVHLLIYLTGSNMNLFLSKCSLRSLLLVVGVPCSQRAEVQLTFGDQLGRDGG